MQRLFSVLSLSAALAFGALAASAAHHTVQDDVTAQLSGIEEKLVGLAEAMPGDKLSWRPSEGVRSVSEVLMHVAGASYFIASRLGMDVPEGVDPRSMEDVTDKDEIVEKLEAAMEFAREAVNSVSEDATNEEVTLFGQQATKRKAMLALVQHSSEHLGQLIAYARMNDVTPPWSE